MEELFITKIHIHEVRHLKDFDIPLSETERRHLILTGRNGSGKTSVLEAIGFYISQINGHLFQKLESRSLLKVETSLPKLNVRKEFEAGHLVIAYFGAKRGGNFHVPSGARRFDHQPVMSMDGDDEHGKAFIQYLVNLRMLLLDAKDSGEEQLALELTDWFSTFELKLGELFGNKGVKLVYDRYQFNFDIIEPGKKPYTLNQLSDGYGAVLRILADLIMRVQSQGLQKFDLPGIVLIDEIETHLHIDLQKKILPFLTSFFPKIQFIVTTHSPFVLNSVDNAVICDLEKRIVTTDLSGYSSEIIVESYFGTDKYSQILKDQVDEYEKLMGQETLSFEDEDRLDELESYFETIPKYLADELTVKLQQIRLKNLKLQN